MSGDRIIVASEIAEEFAERLAERAGLRTGDPADPQTVIGPLISASAASRVAGMVDEAGAIANDTSYGLSAGV
jgi:vanillin dehydrogenase